MPPWAPAAKVPRRTDMSGIKRLTLLSAKEVDKHICQIIELFPEQRNFFIAFFLAFPAFMGRTIFPKIHRKTVKI